MRGQFKSENMVKFAGVSGARKDGTLEQVLRGNKQRFKDVREGSKSQESR